MTVGEFVQKVIESHVDPGDSEELARLNEIAYILEVSYVGDMTVDVEKVGEILNQV